MAKGFLKTVGTLCWCCRNAYDHCRWSSEGLPVQGWRAVRNDLPPVKPDGPPVKSYVVLRCPEFMLEDRFKEEYRRFLAKTERSSDQYESAS